MASSPHGGSALGGAAFHLADGLEAAEGGIAHQAKLGKHAGHLVVAREGGGGHAAAHLRLQLDAHRRAHDAEGAAEARELLLAALAAELALQAAARLAAHASDHVTSQEEAIVNAEAGV